MTLAEKLVYLRKEKGLSQVQLAEMMDVSRQAISRWETGASSPTSENLKYLSTLYNVSLDYLLNDAMEESMQEDRAVEYSEDHHKQNSPDDIGKHQRLKLKDNSTVSYILYLVAMGILLMLGAITNVQIIPALAITLDFGLIIHYLNIFGIFFMASVCLVVLVFTKSKGSVKDAFLFMFRKQKFTLLQYENCLLSVKTTIVSAFISGGILLLMSAVNALYSMNLSSRAREHIGPQLGMGLSGVVYSCIIFFILRPVYLTLKRGLLEKKMKQDADRTSM